MRDERARSRENVVSKSKNKTPEHALDAYLRRHPGTRYLDAFVCDLSCVMRGKRFPIDAAGKVFTDGMMLPGSVFMLSVSGDSHDPEGMGFSDGDPDEVARPIEGALAPAPWARQPSAQVLLTLCGLDGAPYYFEPRNVLARVLARFDELQLRPVVAFELEFSLLDAAHDGDDDGGGLRPAAAPGGRRARDAGIRHRPNRRIRRVLARCHRCLRAPGNRHRRDLSRIRARAIRN
ncbi:MAG: hypothetical protein OD918_02990 [Gammaproteobacteria bacterium]